MKYDYNVILCYSGVGSRDRSRDGGRVGSVHSAIGGTVQTTSSHPSPAQGSNLPVGSGIRSSLQMSQSQDKQVSSLPIN